MPQQTYSPNSLTVTINGREFFTHVEQAAAATGQDPQDVADALTRLSERHRDDDGRQPDFERASGDQRDAIADTLGVWRGHDARYFDLSRDGSGRIEHLEPESDEHLRQRILARFRTTPYESAQESLERTANIPNLADQPWEAPHDVTLDQLTALYQPRTPAAAQVYADFIDRNLGEPWESPRETLRKSLDEIFKPAEPYPTLWDHLLGAE